MMRRLAIALTCLFTMITAAPAADLAAINRTIRKEPVYKSQPKYCLLVIGPEAKTRVWLVLDGDVLYVDRNGNGDLTEPDEQVTAEKNELPNERYQSFTVRTMADGSLTHKNLRAFFTNWAGAGSDDDDIKNQLAKDPKLQTCMLFVELELPGFKGGATEGRVAHDAGLDVAGYLQFGDSAKAAPVVHFGGPRQMALVKRQTLRVNREHDLQTGVGTPGVGVGSFGWVGEGEVIPENLYPKVAITYPPRDGQPPVKELYELKHRC